MRSVLLLTVVLAGLLVVVLATGADEGDEPRATARPPAFPDDAPVRGCQERIFGAFREIDGKRVRDPLEVDPERDSTFGAITFKHLRHYARPEVWRANAAAGQWLKSIAYVQAGANVTLMVPPEQRSWFSLEYSHEGEAGVAALTLRGCRTSRDPEQQRVECKVPPLKPCRSGPTAFSGGFRIDYAEAPRQGRCAALWIREEPRAAARRIKLFAPCD